MTELTAIDWNTCEVLRNLSNLNPSRFTLLRRVERRRPIVESVPYRDSYRDTPQSASCDESSWDWIEKDQITSECETWQLMIKGRGRLSPEQIANAASELNQAIPNSHTICCERCLPHQVDSCARWTSLERNISLLSVYAFDPVQAEFFTSFQITTSEAVL